MKYFKKYKLKKDTPTNKKGQYIIYDGIRDKYFYGKWDSFWKKWSEYDCDYSGVSFTLEEIKSEEWFEPIGKAIDYIPKFPTQNKIDEYFDLIPSAHLVDSVDECRAINKMLCDKKFQDELYNFYKKKYEEFYKLTPHPIRVGEK